MMQNNNNPNEVATVELVVKNATTLSPADVDLLASQNMLTREYIIDAVNRRLLHNNVDRNQMVLSCFCEPFDGSKALSSYKAVVTLPSALRGFAPLFLDDLNVNKVLFSAEEIPAKQPMRLVESRRHQNTYTIELKSKNINAGNHLKLQTLSPGDILQRVNDFLKPNLNPNQLALQCESDFKGNAAVLVFPSELDRESALLVLGMDLCLNGVECVPIIHGVGDIRSSSSGYADSNRDSGPVFNRYASARDNVGNNSGGNTGGNMGGNIGGGSNIGRTVGSTVGSNVGSNYGKGKEVVVEDTQNTLILNCTGITQEAMRKSYTSPQLLAAVQAILGRYMSENDVAAIRINQKDIQRVGDWVKLTFPSNDHCDVAEGFLHNWEILPGMVVTAEKISTTAPLLGSKSTATATASAAGHMRQIIPTGTLRSDFNGVVAQGTRRVESKTGANYTGRQIYVFFDMSNIKGALSGHPKQFMETIACGGQNFQFKYACGSMPGKFSQTQNKWTVDEPEWQSFIQSEMMEQVTGPANTWKIDVQPRVRGLGEFNVDEGLCAHVYKNALDNITKNGVIIIVSGDGANDRGCVSIQQTVEHMISMDIFASWTVHLWTWRESCNRRYMDYADLQKNPSLRDRFNLSFFNDYPAVFGERGGSNSKPVYRENPSPHPPRRAAEMESESEFKAGDTVVNNLGSRSECKATVTAVSGTNITITYVPWSWKAGETEIVQSSKLKLYRENPSHPPRGAASPPVYRENPRKDASPVRTFSPDRRRQFDNHANSSSTISQGFQRGGACFHGSRERSPSPETKHSEISSDNRDLYEVIEDNIYTGDSVLKLFKGDIVTVDHYEFDNNWSIVVDKTGQRGYCRTKNIRPMK